MKIKKKIEEVQLFKIRSYIFKNPIMFNNILKNQNLTRVSVINYLDVYFKSDLSFKFPSLNHLR